MHVCLCFTGHAVVQGHHIEDGAGPTADRALGHRTTDVAATAGLVPVLHTTDGAITEDGHAAAADHQCLIVGGIKEIE